jgi:hypothetical protein
MNKVAVLLRNPYAILHGRHRPWLPVDDPPTLLGAFYLIPLPPRVPEIAIRPSAVEFLVFAATLGAGIYLLLSDNMRLATGPAHYSHQRDHRPARRRFLDAFPQPVRRKLTTRDAVSSATNIFIGTALGAILPFAMILIIIVAIRFPRMLLLTASNGGQSEHSRRQTQKLRQATRFV